MYISCKYSFNITGFKSSQHSVHKKLPDATSGTLLRQIQVECLSRNCKICENRSLTYQQFNNSRRIKHKKWLSVVDTIEDPKTKITRKVRKFTKKILVSPPKDVIVQLEKELIRFLQHERNAVHQYQTIKSLKTSLTEKDCIIHMDFSENYCTKFSEEVQAFHFGGSRTQLSLHTVVVYTKGSKESFCTMSTNLNHNVPAIWAHLDPILKTIPKTVENIHFLSDGPVTQ